MDWIFGALQNSYVETLNLIVMVVEGGAFERRFGHKDEALMNRISALMIETPESSFASSIIWGHLKNTAI